MNLVKRIVFLILLSVSSQPLWAQLDKDYEPIVFTGSTLPQVFLKDFKKETKQSIKENSYLSEARAEAFYQELAHTREELLTRGVIYHEGAPLDYIVEVKEKLLRNDRQLNEEVTIYLTRFSSPNAFATPNGDVFVNIGLFSILDNEYELAFIIAHEIAHYAKKHSIKRAKKMDDLSSAEVNSENIKGSMFRKLRFSREDEFNADAKAIELLRDAGFSQKLGVLALEKLQNDSVYSFSGMDSTIVRTFQLEASEHDSALFNKNVRIRRSENVFISRSEDLHKSHPNLDKRLSAAETVIRLNDKINTPTDSIGINQSSFEKVKEMAIFEKAHNLFKGSDYISSLFLSLHLKDIYPSNSFINTLILKNIHRIGYYSELEKLEKISANPIPSKESDYNILLSFLFNKNHNDLKKIGYIFAENQEDLHKHEEFLLFYALAAESYVGKDSSKPLFRAYLQKFPNGQYASLARTKTRDDDF